MKKLLTLFTALILFGSMTMKAQDTWTPAGTPASVFGEEWNPELTANDMTLSNGLYVFAKQSDFSATSIEFKVCKNHGWGTAYPGSNYGFTIPNGSKYLIITYNPSGNNVNAIAISSMTVAGDNATLFGSGTTWSPSTTANDMTLQSEGTYKFEKTGVALSAGTVSFKACANHGWDNAWPSANYELSIPEGGDYTISITFNPATLAVNATATLEQPAVVIPTIQLYSDITNPAWETSANFVVAANEETASLTLTDVAKGTYHFGIQKDGAWTSNASSFTRANNSHIITGDNGNCSFNADRAGDYTFTWTFETNTLEITYPALPAQSVAFNGLASQVLKGATINFEEFVTSSGIENPGYRFYVKEKNGSYGSAVSSYTFDAVGEFVVKVEALENNTGDPVAEDESDVLVYDTHTFNSGTTIYVDFSAMTEGDKGVNYPKADEAALDWDGNGAGTIKVVTFTTDVTWNTTQDFIKTEEGGWDPGMKFSVPSADADMIVVAADGASYTWSTFVPSTYYLKNKWDDVDWTWEQTTAAGDGTYRLENVIFGGNGVNYNLIDGDEGATWKEYTKIKYKEGATEKVVAVFDTINLVLDPANDTIWAEMIKKESVVYTVAGSSLALFDLGWEPTHPYKYTDMKKQADGTYKWDNGGNEATLPAGWIELKVVKNRSFANGCWPKIENFAYEIKRSGEYEIAIHFNPYTEAIWIDTVLTEPLNIQALSIKGSWDGWAAATPLKLGGENDKSLVTLSLAEGTYNFKLVDGQNSWYGGGEAFTRNSFTHNGIVAKEEAAAVNMTVNIDKAGEYLFSYFFDTEQLMISYPAIVPAEVIAPLSGRFTINAQGDSVRFARGNLMYNYETDKWYTAEKQYEVLGDLNLRFGDNTYTGSIDLFGWSTENSDYGKQWKYKDEEFNGDFKDWGELFIGDEKEWSTLSETEWNYIMDRKKGDKKLWTMIALTSDSLNGLALFPDDWVAPACASEMVYGFYNLDDTPNYRKNTFMLDEWAELEAAGAVFIPLAGARAGFWGNTWTGSAESSLSNPLSLGYDWVDNVNWMGYYWLSTNKNAKQASTAILPGWHDYKWNVPTIWSREKRRGQPVRLVTRCPNFDYQRDGLTLGRVGTLCIDHNVEVGDIYGGTFYQIAGKTEAGNIVFDEVTSLNAGEPYIYQATASTIGVYYGSISVASPVPVKGMYGSFEDFNLAIDEGNKLNILYIAGNKIHDCSDIATLQVVANRCYIKLDEVPAASPNVAPGRRRITLGRDEATGLFDLNTSDAPRKLLINGTIYILRGENVYDATGRLVK